MRLAGVATEQRADPRTQVGLALEKTQGAGGREAEGGEAKCWLISVMRLWKFSSVVLSLPSPWPNGRRGGDIGDSVKCH